MGETAGLNDAAAAAGVPLIDASALHADRPATIAAVADAAQRIGFFYLTDHGIARPLIDDALTAARAFFALPVEAKSQVAVDRNQRGWLADGMSRMRGAAQHDYKEVFFWGRELPPGHAELRAGTPLVAANRWPAAMPQLRPQLLPYYDAVCTLARRLLAVLAVALGAPARFFEPFYQRPLARGQLVYYPPADRPERYGVAPHSDFGVLTLLLQDDRGGLRIKTRDGRWLDAPPLPGTLVCNIGDLLQRWSNDRLRSTEHAVVNASGRERYSLPVFFDPAGDAVIDPRDLGLRPGDEPRYPPVAAGDYIAGRNRQSFSHYATQRP